MTLEHHAAAKSAQGGLFRYLVLGIVAVQMLVGWTLPMLFGSSSEAQLHISRGDARMLIFGWSLLVGLGHIAALFYSRLQRSFGALHALGCLIIGLSLLESGFTFRGILYGTAYTALGLAISVTAERTVRS